MMCARIPAAKLAMNTLRYFLPPALLALSVAAPASAQYACTTNYCISSQSISFQTPPGWPAVAVEPCCRTHWGVLPGAIDWSNGARRQAGIRDVLPELRRPAKRVAGFSPGLRAADIRHRRRLAECEGLSLRDAKRSARRRIRRNLRAIFQSARSSHELVGARAQRAEAWDLRVHRRGKLPKRRKGLLRRAQQLQAQSAIFAPGPIARYATRSAKSCRARRWRGERLRGAITWGNEAVDRPQPAGYAPLPIGWGGLLPALRARRTIAFARAAGGPECFHQRCFSRSLARCSLPSPTTFPPSTSKPAVERCQKWATA